jgi:hypothetical protein
LLLSFVTKLVRSATTLLCSVSRELKCNVTGPASATSRIGCHSYECESSPA